MYGPSSDPQHNRSTVYYLSRIYCEFNPDTRHLILAPAIYWAKAPTPKSWIFSHARWLCCMLQTKSKVLSLCHGNGNNTQNQHAYANPPCPLFLLHAHQQMTDRRFPIVADCIAAGWMSQQQVWCGQTSDGFVKIRLFDSDHLSYTGIHAGFLLVTNAQLNLYMHSFHTHLENVLSIQSSYTS